MPHEATSSAGDSVYALCWESCEPKDCILWTNDEWLERVADELDALYLPN